MYMSNRNTNSKFRILFLFNCLVWVCFGDFSFSSFLRSISRFLYVYFLYLIFLCIVKEREERENLEKKSSYYVRIYTYYFVVSIIIIILWVYVYSRLIDSINYLVCVFFSYMRIFFLGCCVRDLRVFCFISSLFFLNTH